MTPAAPRVRRPPLLLLVPGIAAVGLLTVPLIGLLARVSWSTLGSDLTSSVALDALRLSLVCSLWATGLSLVLGLPLAWLKAGRLLRDFVIAAPLERAASGCVRHAPGSG